MISLSRAKKLVKLARDSISSYFDNKELAIADSIKKEFGEKQGVFVTLYLGEELKGCIGFPEPVLPLYEAIVEAARSAAFSDPRFPSLRAEEFKELKIEISVLTKPEEIKVKEPSEYPSNVKIGEDGLIIKGMYGSGLLLPQVATEWNFDSEEFLNQVCVKAGLEPNYWRKEKCKIYKFQAQIFNEENGKLVEKKLY